MVLDVMVVVIVNAIGNGNKSFLHYYRRNYFYSLIACDFGEDLKAW